MSAALLFRILKKVCGFRNPFCRKMIAKRYIRMNTIIVIAVSRLESVILLICPRSEVRGAVVLAIFIPPVQTFAPAEPEGRSFLNSALSFSLTIGALRTTRTMTTTALYAASASDCTSNL